MSKTNREVRNRLSKLNLITPSSFSQTAVTKTYMHSKEEDSQKRERFEAAIKRDDHVHNEGTMDQHGTV